MVPLSRRPMWFTRQVYGLCERIAGFEWRELALVDAPTLHDRRLRRALPGKFQFANLPPDAIRTLAEANSAFDPALASYVALPNQMCLAALHEDGVVGWIWLARGDVESPVGWGHPIEFPQSLALIQHEYYATPWAQAGLREHLQAFALCALASQGVEYLVRLIDWRDTAEHRIYRQAGFRSVGRVWRWGADWSPSTRQDRNARRLGLNCHLPAYADRESSRLVIQPLVAVNS